MSPLIVKPPRRDARTLGTPISFADISRKLLIFPAKPEGSPKKNLYSPYFYVVPGAGVEPARDILPRDFKSLASTYSATRARRCASLGGWGRNRTGVHGFAGRCITTLPPSQGRRSSHIFFLSAKRLSSIRWKFIIVGHRYFTSREKQHDESNTH